MLESHEDVLRRLEGFWVCYITHYQHQHQATGCQNIQDNSIGVIKVRWHNQGQKKACSVEGQSRREETWSGVSRAVPFYY